MIRRFVTALALIATCPTLASAQFYQPMDTAPDTETTRQLGPLYVRPTITLGNAGVDTNVFNDADPLNPASDFTITLSPAATVWLPVGLTWVRGTVQEDLVWYREFSSERAANTSTSLGWTAPLTRVTFSLRGLWLRTSERPGFEIDERARRWERAFGGGFEVKTFARTFIGINAERRVFDFDDDESFQGALLDATLDRHQVTVGGTLRHELTPLTSLAFEVGLQQDRFDHNVQRDGDSTRIVGGFRFSPDALISGSADIGYRNYRPDSAAIPGYSGTTANVNLSYVARATTKLSMGVTRDVEYSYDINQPYYLLSGVFGSVTQPIYGPLDVEGRARLERMAYRNRTDVPVLLPDRVDHYRSAGGGVGYRLGSDLRVGFTFDYATRASDIELHTYDGWRYGTTASYGF